MAHKLTRPSQPGICFHTYLGRSGWLFKRSDACEVELYSCMYANQLVCLHVVVSQFVLLSMPTKELLPVSMLLPMQLAVVTDICPPLGAASLASVGSSSPLPTSPPDLGATCHSMPSHAIACHHMPSTDAIITCHHHPPSMIR